MVTDDGSKELNQHINNIKFRIGALAVFLQAALTYIDTDCHSSLTKCRIVTEKILHKVYLLEMGKEPKQGMLGYILSDKEFISKIPNRIVARITLIKDLSNLGPHGGQASTDDAHLVLEETVNLIDWIISKYDINKVQEQGEPQSIEMYAELKGKLGEELRPDIKSIKFVQERNRCYLEVTISKTWDVIMIDRWSLEFFQESDFDNETSFNSFNPYKKITENARTFIDDWAESFLTYWNGLFK